MLQINIGEKEIECLSHALDRVFSEYQINSSILFDLSLLRLYNKTK